MNPLKLIPDAARAWVYAGYAFIGVILGSIVTAYGAVSSPLPPWLVITLAVFVYLGGALGLTAISNIPGAPSTPVKIPTSVTIIQKPAPVDVQSEQIAQDTSGVPPDEVVEG